MDTSSFDAQIKDLEQQIGGLRGQMENICKEFLEVTKEFTVAWFRNHVERTVTSQPKIAKKCGVEELRHFKSDLQKTITMVPRIVEEHVNNDKYWAHRGQIPDEHDRRFARYHVSGRCPLDELDNAVREVLGYRGVILLKHGFAKTGEHSEWETKYGSEQPRYKYGYDWSEKMNTVLKQYSDLYDRLIKLDYELKKAKRDKAQAEAKNLWDQA